MNFDLHYVVANVIVFGLVLVWPILDAWQAKRLREECTSAARKRHYAAVLLMSIALALLGIWLVGPARILSAGTALAAARLEMPNQDVRLSLMLLAILLIGVAALPALMRLRRPEVGEMYVRAIKKSKFTFLFPTDTAERRLFAVLAINAGLCEEIVFRSFLVDYFHSAPWSFGPFVAMALSCLVFGMNHVYQGLSGIPKTGIIGMAFGLLFFTTGSLVLCMVIHALVDLQVLVMLRPGWDRNADSDLNPERSPLANAAAS